MKVLKTILIASQKPAFVNECKAGLCKRHDDKLGHTMAFRTMPYVYMDDDGPNGRTDVVMVLHASGPTVYTRAAFSSLYEVLEND